MEIFRLKPYRMCLAEMKFLCTTSLYYRIEIHGEIRREEFLKLKVLYENMGFPCGIIQLNYFYS
jgi:hypothetical protein